MNRLSLTLERPDARYLPGEEVRGAVEWDLESDPAQLEVVLFWYTEGKGSSDSHTVASEVWEQPGSQGRRGFQLVLPSAPHSFSGKLISLRWAVEVFCKKPRQTEHVDLSMSPSGGAIELGEPEEEGSPVHEMLTRLKSKGR